MTYRTILAAISGGSATTGTIEIAGRLAQRFGAHLEGLHVRIDPLQILASSIDGIGMPLPTEWIEGIEKEVAGTVARTKELFKSAAARYKLPITGTPSAAGASASWRDETGLASQLIARRARFFDLAVLGRSERVAGKPYSDAIEQVLLQGACPVLLAPADAPKEIGEKVALGWNGSAEAVRALHMTLPFLARAKAVTLVTVEAQAEQDVAAAIAYLSWHGISASHRGVTPLAGVGHGEQLVATARDIGADLLIMGGYGKAPWREAVFGGATRHVLQSSMLPILMSH